MKIPWLILLTTLITACSRQMNRLDLSEEINSEFSLEGYRTYKIHHTISLINQGGERPDKQNLWVALIQTIEPYQELISRRITPENYQLIEDEYNNSYAEFDLSNHPPGTRYKIEINYRVKINELNYDLSSCSGEMIDSYIEPELHIESANPQIFELSKTLSKYASTPCDRVRAFYDYAGDELIYSYNRNSWGAQATLGEMGADCTEYASLVIALSRAAGIPARYYEGILYHEEPTEVMDQTEHAWLDVYLPSVGWMPIDPTLGRGSLNRETHFGHYTPDHIIITVGRNPSTLRGSSYWTHLYWPGDVTTIRVDEASWSITPVD